MSDQTSTEEKPAQGEDASGTEPGIQSLGAELTAIQNEQPNSVASKSGDESKLQGSQEST